MNKIFSGLANLLTGGIGDRVMNVIERQFPGKLTPQETAQLQQSLAEIDAEREKQGEAALAEATRLHNERVAQYEGTASEVKDMFLIGPLIILIRSLFRPLCSYAVVYMDYIYFTSNADGWPDNSTMLLVVMNVIVLGFWFGERTIKNLMPLILAWLDKRELKSDAN